MTKTWPWSYRFPSFLSFAKVMQCMEYSKIWLNLTFAAQNQTFIRRQKAFPVFHADRVIIRLPCGQGQPSRIWKVQCDWLSLGKKCCFRLSRRLWGGMKDELPYKRLRGRPELLMVGSRIGRAETRVICLRTKYLCLFLSKIAREQQTHFWSPLLSRRLRIWIKWNLKGEFSRILSNDLYWENRTYKLKRSIARWDVSWTVLGAMLQTHTPAIFLIIAFILMPFWPSTLIYLFITDSLHCITSK